MGIDLVVTDLDGTLWDTEGALHPRTEAALDTLAERGVPLLVATGRRAGAARRALGKVGLAPPAVLLNGSLGIHLATGDRFHLGGFETDAAQRVLAAFEANGVDPCLYVEGEAPAVFVSDTPSTHPEHLASFGDSVRTASLADVVAAERILAFGVLGIERDVGEAVVASVGDVATTHLDVDRHYGGGWLSVAPRGDSKWDGVVAFCGRHGLDASRVLAIGDGANDVRMLMSAAVAVAPSDAHPDALGVADHVVAPAADGGWAELLDLL
ncbi:MAG: HAD family hydrolase [Ilumatobacter sp.]|uniref:HAD family hydrolase n=1 Tax=Ilumatobacter sp. TaxID=1967498 RepID=UPI00261E5643|nr:HAD family hydrolase [Ilumatobacter sp.]MDJ0767165.1 HAD family hydrolase [Ilumatobacter sp.]